MATCGSSRNMEKIDNTALFVQMFFEKLSSKWDLELRDSDLDPLDKEVFHLKRNCREKIKFLTWKGKSAACISRFDDSAAVLYSNWVKKSSADPGLITKRPPSTRQNPRPLLPMERTKMLKCLLEILEEEYNGTPKRDGGSFTTAAVDDKPISSPFPMVRHHLRAKRPSESFADLDTSSRKLKHPRDSSSAIISQMPPPERSWQGNQKFQSADTSFTSDISMNASKVFSVCPENSGLSSTQETDLGDEDSFSLKRSDVPLLTSNPPETDHQSSEYGGRSSFEARMEDFTDTIGHVREADPANAADDLSQKFPNAFFDPQVRSGIEIGKELLRSRLDSVFPVLPYGLSSASLPVIYEITRVFLHAEVPLTNANFTVTSSMNDYDHLWEFLKNIPVLQGKAFPERCGKELWTAANDGFRRGCRDVSMGGTLHYNCSSPEEPLFRFRLKPMILEQSHRLSRRFGSERFLELSMPDLSGHHMPKLLQDLGEDGQQVLVDWLVDGPHQFLGRSWKPFYEKPISKKRPRRDANASALSKEEKLTHRIYFFAVNGYGFLPAFKGFSDSRTSGECHQMQIKALLDHIRPVRENVGSGFLKLFARTALAVSRNTPTVTLTPSDDLSISEIIYKDDIRCNGEVMTDGAGQMSYSLALRITQQLGLSYVPSGFQGRIGESKGFWTVDYGRIDNRVWISVYESQRKWKLSKEHGDRDHSSHRTFEVVRFSSPLKPAELNLQFMPILMERAQDRKLMQNSLFRLLEEGLERELQEQKLAMGDPRLLRKWLRDKHPSINDKLKNGCVPYRAGLPADNIERLNMLLDAGFSPDKLYFVKDLTRTAFRVRCEELELRLNITVARSTFAYMVPDFAGVLEPQEVFIDFSSFIDNASGFSGTLLNDVDVLVARTPAHYASDIQRVKAVFKVELMGLKDVIVFSTKGNPSLAAKLSGGDYDGDIAWICWEKAIVNNFVSANVPSVPDPVKDGFLVQNTTTYKDLVNRSSNPTALFLKESFKFNMQPNMLGICTDYKETVCYNQNSVDTPESVYLSTLLSHLVDQAKQGYSLSEQNFSRLKSSLIKIKLNPPSYKIPKDVSKSQHVIDSKSQHILDRLFIVANRKAHQALTLFQNQSPDLSPSDDDLVRYYDWAKTMANEEMSTIQQAAVGKGLSTDSAIDRAKRQSEWNIIINHLDDKIGALNLAWSKDYKGSSVDSNNPEYELKIDRFYATFRAIQPPINTPLTQSLLPSYLADQELSQWALLRASALFASFRRRKPGTFVWNIAGKQLAKLKAEATGGTFIPAITPSMLAMLKPDSAFVKRSIAEGSIWSATVDDDASVVNAVDIEDLED